MTHLFNTYARMPVALVRGDGAWLFDDQGRRYLDALSGIAVCSLGHAHPRLAEVIADQARTLIHTANIVHIPQQDALADALAEISGMDQAFIANSGAEAIECALKLARRYATEHGIEAPAVLVATDSFHGRTMAALSASGNPAIQAGFGPLVEGFVRVPFGDLDAASAAFEAHPNLVAALIEPIQGEGGVRPTPPGFLPGLQALCRKHQALLMLDEIQTGMARTGRWFAFQHEDLTPDVVTLAKALGNGVPILRSLEISRTATGNRLLSKSIADATDNIRSGESLAKPLRSSGHFPIAVVEMISVGEESNSLDTVLPEIADSLEKRTFRRLDLFVRLLEPVMLLIMAVLVLAVVLALLVPVLKSSTAI